MDFYKQQKEEAIARMKLLRLRKNVVQNFTETGLPQVCTRPNGRFILLNAPELDKVRKFQKEYTALVYAVLRAVTIYGTLDSYLYVSSEAGEWKEDRKCLDEGYTLTYTVNQNFSDFSEFGFIDFSHTRSKGLVRTDIDFF